jgi:hypothetical protein
VTRLLTRPRMVCPDPSCRTELSGGPIRYRCEQCCMGVFAADAVPAPEPTPPTETPPVTFTGAVRERLPRAAASATIAAGALVAGYLTATAAVHAGVIPW